MSALSRLQPLRTGQHIHTHAHVHQVHHYPFIGSSKYTGLLCIKFYNVKFKICFLVGVPSIYCRLVTIHITSRKMTPHTPRINLSSLVSFVAGTGSCEYSGGKEFKCFSKHETKMFFPLSDSQ